MITRASAQTKSATYRSIGTCRLNLQPSNCLPRNRAHSNVAFLLGEETRYQPGLDTLTVYPGVLSSYPNFMFNIPAGQVPAFVEAMERAQDEPAFERIVERWGIRRSHPQFWYYFHDLSQYIQETEPVESGVLDMNRYENL